MRGPGFLDIAHIGHVELLTSEFEKSRWFFTELLAFREVAAEGDSVFLHAWDDYERYTIKLTANGQKLVRLKTGTYKFVLHDRASIHSWSLDGPNGFAKDLTTVPFVGTKTVTLTLKAGKYKYYCPPHEAMMFGHFSVVA